MMTRRFLQLSAALALGLAPFLAAHANEVTVAYLHTDAQGSVVAETDEAGEVVERREYEPYGLPQEPMEGPGYTGHDHDADSGLVYMQQRYYDPLSGRFLSVDPVGVSEENGDNFNRYWYGKNNPISFIDPDGRQACANVNAKCLESTTFDEGNEFESDAVGSEATDAAGRSYAYENNQDSGNERVSRIDASNDDSGEISAETSEIELIDSTPYGAEFDFSEIEGSDAIAHTHPKDSTTIVPGAGDIEAPSRGKPNYIASGRRSGVVEISDGQVRFRMINGKLENHEVSGIQSRLNEFQEVGSGK